MVTVISIFHEILILMHKRKFACQCGDLRCRGECTTYEPHASNIVRIRPKRRVERSPDVKNLTELIDLTHSDTYYTNLNSMMLRNITPQLKELMRMVGMEDLKESIFCQVLYYIQNMHLVSGLGNNDFLHTCLMGGPGAGKTTVAKIIAEMYRGLGVLSKNGVFKIATRSDLIGGYLGQTAMKTRTVLDSCVGGVLFIDEVYSLGAGEERGADSYSKECIDTINGFMSEHKKDFCLIVAGYEEEIDRCFFSVNVGLRSRFPWRHVLKPYKPIELAEIATKMVLGTNWKTTTISRDLADIIKENHAILFQHEARSVENWIAKVKLAHSKRVFALPFSEKFILNLEDFKAGVDIMKKNEKAEDSIPDMYT